MAWVFRTALTDPCQCDACVGAYWLSQQYWQLVFASKELSDHIVLAAVRKDVVELQHFHFEAVNGHVTQYLGIL